MKSLFISCLSFLSIVSLAHAATDNSFVPLVGVPFIKGGVPTSIGDYVNAFYYAAISVAAFLAVLKIIIAGVKYMTTEAVTTKGDARKDIRTSIIGLLLVVGAVLILKTINPNLAQVTLNAPSPSIGLATTSVTITDKLTQICNSTYGCTKQKCSALTTIMNGYADCKAWCASMPNSVYIDNGTVQNYGSCKWSFLWCSKLADECDYQTPDPTAAAMTNTKNIASERNPNINSGTVLFQEALPVIVNGAYQINQKTGKLITGQDIQDYGTQLKKQCAAKGGALQTTPTGDGQNNLSYFYSCNKQ